MSAVVRRIESIVPRKAQAFGGKAKNLAALARAGFPGDATRKVVMHWMGKLKSVGKA